MFKEQKTVDAISLTDYLNKPLTAFFLGSKSVDTKFGEQFLHNFQKEDGKKISVWGFTSLNRLLEMTPVGTFVKVTYIGKSTTKNKYGNKSHLVTVFFDPDKKLEGFGQQEEQPYPFDTKGTEDDSNDNDSLPF